MRRFPLEGPVAQVIETAAPWLISRSDVHTTRRLMRLEAIDGVSRSLWRTVREVCAAERFARLTNAFRKSVSEQRARHAKSFTTLGDPNGN